MRFLSPPRAGVETGSVTVVLCGVLALVTALTLAIGRLAAVTVAVARAETAADAAALAAAGELAAGRSAAEAGRSASSTAKANGARLLRCECAGQGATVTVAVTLLGPGSPASLVKAAARAELHPDCPG